MICLLICTGILLSGADGQGVDEALARQIASLVRQLDARQLTARDEAEAAIEALGPRALPLLPAVDDRTPPEVAQRLSRLRQKLLRAEATAATDASRVTLHGDNLSLAAVLAEIAKQTGNPITDHRATFGQRTDDRRVTVHFDKTPFWQALDEVLDQSDLTLYGFAGERGAFIINRSPGDAPRGQRASYAGLFRFEPVRFEAQRDLRDQNQGSLRMFMEVSWEPRLQPFAVMQSRSEVHAVCSSGDVMKPAIPQAAAETLVREGFSTTQLEIPFELPPRGAEEVSSLKGQLLALLPGPLADFRFEELPLAAGNTRARPVEMRNGNTLVTVNHVRENNEVWEVGLRLRVEAPSAALESHRGWILENEAYFEDAEGNRILPGGFEQTLHTQEEIGINYFFDLPKGPHDLTLVYRTPLMILELPVKYEFHDLKLP